MRKRCKTMIRKWIGLCKCGKICTIMFPAPSPMASHVLLTWRHGEWLLCRLTTDISIWAEKNSLSAKVQLSLAFLSNYTNHFWYFNRKLETTVSFVMSHVSPANFQALDQRVSRNFPVGKDCSVGLRQRHMADSNNALCFWEFRNSGA